MSLPNPGMDFVPFDILTAEELDNIVENVEALSSGTGLSVASVIPENLIAGAGTTWGWRTWTPTWTNLTVGNGTVTSRYSQVGKKITVALDFVLGSTSSVSGGIIFTLPVAAHSRYVAGSGSGRVSAGLFYAEDFGTGGYTLFATFTSTTTVQLYCLKSDSVYQYLAGTSSSAPFSWGSTDFFGGTFTYEAA